METQSANQNSTDVIIAGAGPTGLTLACDLARRGVKFRIFDKSAAPFHGSRGKGIQPRTIEVFDDLGVARQLQQAGERYPRMKLHVSFLKLTWHMMKQYRATPDVPFPHVQLVPQWRTEEVLRKRLAEFGHSVEWGNEVLAIAQDERGVTVRMQRGGTAGTVRARYLVGSDGGRGFVRKHLGVPFIGTTSQEGRMIVGDVHVDGLSREHWHVWPKAKGGMVGLCPLPHSDLFQLMIQLDPSDQEPVLTEAAIQARWLAATGLKKIQLYDPTWLSVFRPNVRLVERYRVGRVFLAGDAAHVHTPAGAQGLNTGVQDAYNLGWKLALALGGAPDALLDTYQEERMPVAAGVLELSSELFKSVHGAGLPKLSRGDKERQLLVNYRGSSLAPDAGGADTGGVRAGDRAPDAPCSTRNAGRTTLFDAFRGPHFTVLAFGAQAAEAARRSAWADSALLRVCPVLPAHAGADPEALVDQDGHARAAYGLRGRGNAAVLVRPDGYIGRIAHGDWQQAIDAYMAMVAGTLPYNGGSIGPH